MKIRLQSGSIRFRLRRRDVQSLLENGSTNEIVHLGNGAFSCTLGFAEGGPKLSILTGGIQAMIPKADAQRWATNDEVGMYYALPEGTRLMIEKDWACMEPTAGDSDEGTFPRPISTKSAP